MDQNTAWEILVAQIFHLSKKLGFITLFGIPFPRDFSLEHDESGPRRHNIFFFRLNLSEMYEKLVYLQSGILVVMPLFVKSVASWHWL